MEKSTSLARKRGRKPTLCVLLTRELLEDVVVRPYFVSPQMSTFTSSHQYTRTANLAVSALRLALEAFSQAAYNVMTSFAPKMAVLSKAFRGCDKGAEECLKCEYYVLVLLTNED